MKKKTTKYQEQYDNKYIFINICVCVCVCVCVRVACVCVYTITLLISLLAEVDKPNNVSASMECMFSRGKSNNSYAHKLTR